jgi:hypothetical protein
MTTFPNAPASHSALCACGGYGLCDFVCVGHIVTTAWLCAMLGIET